MGKKVHDDVLDQALNYVKNNADVMYACTGEPADYAGVAAVALADVAMTSSDYTVADNAGTGAGRKVTVAEKGSVTIDTSGTATHIALVKSTSTATLLYVTTCTSLYLTAGQTMTFGTWDIIIKDPT